MNKLKELLNSYFWLVVAVWLILIFAFVFWLSGRIDTNRFDKKVNQQTNQANTAVKQAVNANNAAVNADIERRAEDAVREKVINPKLRDAQRKSNDSKIELERVKRKINDEKQTLHNLNASRADNCAELARLFPDERFQYCLD